MKIETIMSTIDNTVLKATALDSDIYALCDDAMKYKMATVCIPMSFLEKAKEYTKGNLKLCTVIGFPLGYSSTASKVKEAVESVKLGADEVDMVINISSLKNGEFDYVENEIREIKNAIAPTTLKVIIETCYLTEEEKIKMCEIVTRAKADFIKTSTGFGTNGATLEDIKLFKKYVGENVKIKAAGGIRSLQDAIDFIEAGASRLGTSAGTKIYDAYVNNQSEIKTDY